MLKFAMKFLFRKRNVFGYKIPYIEVTSTVLYNAKELVEI